MTPAPSPSPTPAPVPPPAPAPVPGPEPAPAPKHPNRDPSREHPTITADDAATASPIELDDPPESAVGEEDPGAADDVAANEGDVPRAEPKARDRRP